MTDKVIKLTPKYVQKAEEILSGLSKQQIEQVASFFTTQFVEEIEQGLDGEIGYEDSAVFERIDRLYEASQPKGCYFCDRSIDGNETPFDYPDTTKLCLTCQLKVANLLKAFAVDPKSLFPAMGDRKIQSVIYDELKAVIKPAGTITH